MFDHAVAQGASRLDDHQPGWWRHIDVDTLRMDCMGCCVIGQLSNQDAPCAHAHDSDYVDHARNVRITRRYSNTLVALLGADGVFREVQHGFIAGGNARAWDALRDTWVQHINARLLADEYNERMGRTRDAMTLVA